ncbi:beta-L-arabinofuranosidase domain-containing protein [Cohnella nanjingensis]|uniref:beta-L-arabinofuranosidase domain-containing protein n=1 Tax=Cohnella nanjingensis TaxID=1387779 RepID=UPI001C86C9B6|nr:beta-L-arabinofuranosidase domain-containing protein [Cohnella nanjingensis]
METEEYAPPRLFRDDAYSWPGDWEGRTLLGWTLLARSTRRPPEYLEEAIRMLPSRLNEKGFFGPVHPRGTVDEQQLSGNSWFLRALCEYYLWTKDDFALSVIHRLIDNLLLPAVGYYAEYPLDPVQRSYDGSAIGELFGKVGAWHLSTDIGCAFIMLDGATQAYLIVPKPELRDLIDEMIEKFMTADIIGLSFQTHATLSALRGILRHYETTGDPRLLEKAIDTFGVYMQRGMTENYANYNWFGRPDWTEPCAVVDSFIVAVGLWKHTGNSAYLEAAHHIYYNGLGYGQRPNGGFGCDVCAGVRDEMLSPKEGLYEAYWCCTMRGAEGLAKAIDSCYQATGRTIAIPFYESSTAVIAVGDGELKLATETDYPYEGVVRIEVMESTVAEPVTLRLFMPSWVERSTVALSVNGESKGTEIRDGFVSLAGHFPKGTLIELSFGIGLRKERAFGFHTTIEGYSYRHGPLLLGIDSPGSALAIGQDERMEPLGEGKYRLAPSNLTLSPVHDMIDKPLEESRQNRKQVLFRDY